MAKWFGKIFRPPVFEGDEEKTRNAEFLNIILWSAFAIIVAAAFPLIYFSETVAGQILSLAVWIGFVSLLTGVYVMLRLGLVRAASMALVVVVWASITAVILFFGGVRTVGVAGYLLVIFLAGLLLGSWEAAGFGLLSMISATGVFFVYYLRPPELASVITVRPKADFDDLFMLFALAAWMAVLLGLVRRSIANTLDRLRRNERALNETNRALQASRDTLEVRTREAERRAAQFRATAEVTRDITAARKLDELLERAVHIIQERFGFYHAGVFLVDERREYAVLRAATGEAGRQMLQQGHRLAVGKTGIAGNVAATGEARIALDVGADAAHFRNPLLPETRSEMALPLRIGTRVIGVLDVQSRQEAAFDTDDIAVLQTMADQLAVAVENARLLSRMEQTVRELEAASGRFTLQAWRATPERSAGYRYRGMDVERSDERPPEAQQAWRQGRSVITASQAEEGQSATGAAAIPIKLRGQVIGVLSLRASTGEIPQRAVSRVEEVADRLAIALENARLLEESQRRVWREQTLGEMAARFTQSLDMDALLQTAVRELGRLPNVAEVSVHIGAPEPSSVSGNGAGED